VTVLSLRTSAFPSETIFATTAYGTTETDGVFYLRLRGEIGAIDPLQSFALHVFFFPEADVPA
jgi:hypothetical protein